MSSTENKNEEVNDIQSIKNISNMELENLLLNLKIGLKVLLLMNPTQS